MFKYSTHKQEIGNVLPSVLVYLVFSRMISSYRFGVFLKHFYLFEVTGNGGFPSTIFSLRHYFHYCVSLFQFLFANFISCYFT